MPLLTVENRKKIPLINKGKGKLIPSSKVKIDNKANKVLGHKTMSGVRKTGSRSK